MQTYDITTIERLTDVVRKVVTYVSNRTEASVVLGLSGDLGAGKTTFVQLLAKEFGVEEQVVSPTYTIMKTYTTNNSTFASLVHIDAYRIETTEEMRVIGFQQLLKQEKTLVCIEWPEHIQALLPQKTIHLTFTFDGISERIVTLSEYEKETN